MLKKYVRRTGLGACMAAAAAILSPATLEAQTALCGKRASIVDSLKSKYKEDRQAIGIAGTNSVIELFISESGTWTMLLTSADGRTCIMAAGHSWDGSPTLKVGTLI